MPFPGQGAAKNAHFWVKMDHDGRLVPGQGNPPGNCLMGHITSQSMGKDDLGPFMPSPATYLVQWGSENGYFWVKNSHWEKIVHTPQVSPEWPNHHQTPSLDMKQCYHACLTTLGPIRPFQSSPRGRCISTPKQPLWPQCAHVHAEMAQKGVKMFNICGSYAQIVFGNVSNHFSLLGNSWLSQ